MTIEALLNRKKETEIEIAKLVLDLEKDISLEIKSSIDLQWVDIEGDENFGMRELEAHITVFLD